MSGGPEYEVFTQHGHTFKIRKEMLAEITAYVEERKEPCPFLQAVLANDLAEAVKLASFLDIDNLPAFIFYLWFQVPSKCWGSPEALEAWINRTERPDEVPRIIQ